MSSTAALFGILLATFAVINAEEMDRNSEYFLTLPATTTVYIGGNAAQENNQTWNNQTWGEFQCATRPGYLPLWIINGVSADLIAEQNAGYNKTSYDLLPLHDQGHMLTILTIPASNLTNNSVVTCAAVKNETILFIVGYSPPVQLFVQINDDSELPITSMPVPSSTTVVASTVTPYPPGTSEKTPALSPQQIKGLSAGLVLLVVAVVVIVVCVAVIVFRRKNRHKRLRARSRSGESNVYWNSMNVNGLEMNNNANPDKEDTESKGSTDTDKSLVES